MVLTESGELSSLPVLVNFQGSLEDQAWRKETDKLKIYNKICGALHLIQAVVIFFMADFSDTHGDMTLPITSLFQNWDAGYPV
jgi:hypothetical protein